MCLSPSPTSVNHLCPDPSLWKNCLPRNPSLLPKTLWTTVLFFFFSSTSLLLPTHLPPPSCTHAQSCNPMDFSPPYSSVHGFFQARILEWVAIFFSMDHRLKMKSHTQDITLKHGIPQGIKNLEKGVLH